MRYQKYIDKFPSLEGKNILITGSNTGLGFEFARLILSKNAHLFMAVRNLDKGNKAIKKLKEEFKDAFRGEEDRDLDNFAKTLLKCITEKEDNKWKIELGKMEIGIKRALGPGYIDNNLLK